MRGLSLIFLFFIGCVGSPKDNTPKIGALVSLSGPAGEQGENIRRGVELAGKELGVRVIVEDDGTNPSRAVRGLLKISTEKNLIGVVGGVWDYLALAVYPVAERNKIRFITPTNPIEIVPEQFRLGGLLGTVAPSLESEKLAVEKFLKLKKPKRVLTVIPNVPFGESKRVMFEGVATDLKIEVLPSFVFQTESPRTDSMRAAAIKIRELNPDVVLVITDYDGLSTLAKEKLQTVFLTSQHLDKALEFEDLDFSNFYGIYPKIFDLDFEEKFQREFGEPPRVFAAHGYDAAKALILNEPFVGATGNCDPSDVQICKGQAVIMTVSNGKLVEF
jgi:branched-chain amino acid transport system substrate-binding protein